jgi:hypothetical protein
MVFRADADAGGSVAGFKVCAVCLRESNRYNARQLRVAAAKEVSSVAGCEKGPLLAKNARNGAPGEKRRTPDLEMRLRDAGHPPKA